MKRSRYPDFVPNDRGTAGLLKSGAIRLGLFLLFAVALGVWAAHPVAHADGAAHQHQCAFCQSAAGDSTASPQASADFASPFAGFVPLAAEQTAPPIDLYAQSPSPRGPPSGLI